MAYVTQSSGQEFCQVQVGRDQIKKCDFAEKLGDVKRRFDKLHALVEEHVKTLELNESHHKAYEKDVNGLTIWLQDHLDRLQNMQRTWGAVSIREAIGECKVRRPYPADLVG